MRRGRGREFEPRPLRFKNFLSEVTREPRIKKFISKKIPPPGGIFLFIITLFDLFIITLFDKILI